MLNTDLLRVYFGDDPPPEFVQIGLAANGVELTDPGYERAKVERGDWAIRDGSAQVTVTFGDQSQGFYRAVAFNESLLIVGDSVTATRFAGTINLIAGMSFEHTETVELGA